MLFRLTQCTHKSEIVYWQRHPYGNTVHRILQRLWWIDFRTNDDQHTFQITSIARISNIQVWNKHPNGTPNDLLQGVCFWLFSAYKATPYYTWNLRRLQWKSTARFQTLGAENTILSYHKWNTSSDGRPKSAHCPHTTFPPRPAQYPGSDRYKGKWKYPKWERERIKDYHRDMISKSAVWMPFNKTFIRIKRLHWKDLGNVAVHYARSKQKLGRGHRK